MMMMIDALMTDVCSVYDVDGGGGDDWTMCCFFEDKRKYATLSLVNCTVK